jgi:hypothetical protein
VIEITYSCERRHICLTAGASVTKYFKRRAFFSCQDKDSGISVLVPAQSSEGALAAGNSLGPILSVRGVVHGAPNFFMVVSHPRDTRDTTVAYLRFIAARLDFL